jgi:hypothetical protein
MTHHVTKHYQATDAESLQANGKSVFVGVTEEYHYTDEELADAGFQLREIEEMPEKESEFASHPSGGEPCLIHRDALYQERTQRPVRQPAVLRRPKTGVLRSPRTRRRGLQKQHVPVRGARARDRQRPLRRRRRASADALQPVGLTNDRQPVRAAAMTRAVRDVPARFMNWRRLSAPRVHRPRPPRSWDTPLPGFTGRHQPTRKASEHHDHR